METQGDPEDHQMSGGVSQSKFFSISTDNILIAEQSGISQTVFQFCSTTEWKQKEDYMNYHRNGGVALI